uniref:Mediator of RNA polymerase II transcription subunit 13 n=1 Tax=Parascaris univalens TaxID=6257 RepID=A0A915CHH7_PARUN
MSNSSKMTTNGGSLEDCHTNVFALTELNGLKWKCLTTPLSQRTWTSLEHDPVLSAYAKCLQAGILCAWRRQPPQPSSALTALPLPDYRIDVVKELWVFWYSQEEPECLAQYTSHLSCGEDGQGNWSVPGIQYETRTLFFKALHNLIERNLLKNGYIRIGKYFARPYEVPSADRVQCSPSYITGISFNFFVHGENTVCTSVNIQRQPTLFRLSRRHLDRGKRQPVILGPWSLRAHLLPDQPRIVTIPTPTSHPPFSNDGGFPSMEMNKPSVSSLGGARCEPPFGAHQSTVLPCSSSAANNMSSVNTADMHNTIAKETVDKLWTEWLQFFALPYTEKTARDDLMENMGYIGANDKEQIDRSDMPKMVMVDVDGVRMWYPSALIVVQASDDLLLRREEGESSEEELENLAARVHVTHSSNTSAMRAATPISLRKRQRKHRETELDGPNGERRNMMYNTMVNGARAAQRFFEEACMLPSSARRRESMESPASSGLGLLISGGNNDDDTRWNLTDGMRRKEREHEHCSCRQCQIASSSRAQMSGAASTSGVSSQSATPQHGTPQPTRVPTPCCNGGDETAPGTPKEAFVLFHRRSPSCARSPSPPRSPFWEERLSTLISEPVDSERGSPDWVHESVAHGSSLSSSRSTRLELNQDDRYQYPESPSGGIPESPDYRKVHRKRLGSSLSKPVNCKPVYQNLSPSTSRPRSPVSGVPQASGTLGRFLSSGCLNAHCFSPLNVPPESGRGNDEMISKKLIKVEVGDVTSIRTGCLEQKVLPKDREFQKPRRRKDRLGNRKLKWNTIDLLDVSYVAREIGEDDRCGDLLMDEPMVTVKAEPMEADESECAASSQITSITNTQQRSITPAAMQQPQLLSSSASSCLPVYSQGLSVPNTSSGVTMPGSSGGLGSDVYGVDSDTQFLDDCSPSTVAMMDTSSPMEPVTDSVHLSPPASNERVEPQTICSSLGGAVTNNLLARVGGPPSVGDYMIYPTPPSVDASQSQPFSPQNILLQSNSANTIYAPSAAPFMMQPFTTATNICHTLAPQLLPNTIHDVETCENLVTLKKEMENDEESIDRKPQEKLERLLSEKPVYGDVKKIEIALSGKFAGDIFKGEPLPLELKNCRMPQAVYADQVKLVNAALAARSKRKRVGRPPDYMVLRERTAQVTQNSTPRLPHYRLNYNPAQMCSSNIPNIQASTSMATPLCGSQPSNVVSASSASGFMGTGSGPMVSNGGGSGMMGMMMTSTNTGMVHSGGAPMHSMIGGPPSMGMQSMNAQMNMAQLRTPGRPQSLSYAPAPTAPGQHHGGGFMGQPQYGVPPSMMSAPGQMGPMHNGRMGPGSMGGPPAAQGLGMIQPGQTPPMMVGGPNSGAPMMHPQMQSQQQPFQQLSQFVNNTNFAGQQVHSGMNPQQQQQQMFQQQLLYRNNMAGNTTPQQSISSPGGYMMDSQASTPIEPPPPFSQAISGRYSNSPSGSATPSVYSQSPQMMRSGGLMAQTNTQGGAMMLGPRTPQSAMLMQAAVNSPMSSQIYPGRPIGMQQMMDISSTTAIRAHPEGKSLVLAVLLQDTVLDLHYDSVFDACPICSCNGNIRAKELGVYITPPEVLRQPPAQQQIVVSKPTSGFYNNTSNPCNCGFSAVRHRYLSMKAGLFPEDAKEATDISENQTQPVIPHTIWFDSMSGRDMNFIALLREQTLVRDLGGIVQQVTMLSIQCERATQFERIGSDSSEPTEYIISEVDQRELPLVFQAACEVACMEMNCRRPPHDNRSVVMHDWGVQIANEMREPREAECLAVLQEVGPVLEETLRIARSAPLVGSNNIVEGPLTWRFFDRKSLKTGSGMEDDSAPEPVPNVLVASERDVITASPQILRMWEKMTLEPYDQPKDVLYIAVVPDSLVCVEKSKKYFDDLSRIYEQCRFGRHIPLAREPFKDGMLRVPARFPSTNPGECDNFLNQVERHMGDNKTLIARLKAYMQCFENEVSRVLLNSDCIFTRDTYRTLMVEHQTQSGLLSSTNVAFQPGAVPSASGSSEQMPPPAAPSSVCSNVQLGDTPQGPNSAGPGSVGPTSAGCNGEPLTPDNVVNGEAAAQAGAMTSSLLAEQVADGVLPDDEPGTLPQVIVLYLVNPFLMGSEENPLVARVVTVALMRAFNALLYRLNVRRRPQLQLEIIGLQSIFDYTSTCADFLKDERGRLNAFDQGRMEKTLNERLSSADSLKTVALSVYSQSRIVLADVVRGILPKSMTRFGPASAMGDLLGDLDKKEPTFYKVPCKPFILAPPPPVMQRSSGDIMQINTDETVLFVSYCLIGNDFLAATVTDHQGHLLDNCLINLRLKPDHKRVNMRYKQSTQIRDSLYRLWSYILGTLATGTKNWRLVIGRVGRIGHGEFKFWTQLLSKSYLKQVGSRMKHACRSCHMMPGTAETPGVLSACLVSLEPEAHLRIFPSSFQHDERFVKNARYRTLTTPDDCSCTHILVFPTSPELNLDHQGGSGAAELEEDDFSNLLTEEIGEEFSDLIGNGEDLISNASGPPPQSAGFRVGGNTGIPSEYADVSIENQPLATGYYVSTAPASELPDWFWSACPSAKRRNPVHLKSSLHLNTPNVQQGDDISSFGAKSSETSHHQLDSQATVDVLRYVLETYNALSWLNMDFVTGERRSCLPVHIQALMRLCNTANRLIN